MRKFLAPLLLCFAVAATTIAGDPAVSPSTTTTPGDHVATAYRATETHASTGQPAALFTRLFAAEEGAGRWDPCTVIRWKMNADGYNKRRFGQVVKALRQLRKATGLTIRYDGLTNDEDIATLEPGVITVSFVPASEMSKDIIGTAGVALNWPDQGGGIARADIRIALHTGYTYKHGYVPVLIHEFGHAVGLGHSSDERSAMYAYENGAYRYNRNDLAGLQAIGASNGCVTPPPPPTPPAPDTTVPDPVVDPVGPVPSGPAIG